jgi:transposase
LKLLLEGRFPRIWVPSGEEKDLRQLLIHRDKLVRLRAQVKNELQHLAMNQGITKKRKLWSKAGEKVLRELPLRAVEQPAARRPVQDKRDVERPDCSARSSRGGSCGEE